jgi:lipopolysaccharide heptosyltransferase II
MVDSSDKILVIRLSSIGDILLSTPFIRQLRKKFKNSQIDFVVRDKFKDLLKNNPHIDNLHILRLDAADALKNLKGKLQKISFDVIFDLHNNLRSNYLRRIGTKRVLSINKSKFKQTILVYFKKNYYNKIIPIPQRYLNVAKTYDVKDDSEGLELYWEEDTVITAENKIKEAGLKGTGKYLCLAPGAGFYTKRWPAENFLRLIQLVNKEFNIPLVLLGGEDDRETGKYLEKKNLVYNFTGKLSLLETAYILSEGLALVSNDTGLMHMATAVKTPVLAIFGSTVREFGFFPFRSQSYVLENKELNCRPCTHIGRNKCPKNHFKCMVDISTEQVFETLKSFLWTSTNQ